MSEQWRPGMFVKQVMGRKDSHNDPTIYYSTNPTSSSSSAPVNRPTSTDNHQILIATPDDEANKKEGILATLMSSARNKYVERYLEGSITISRLAGVVNSSVTCNVSAKATEMEQIDLGDLSRLDRRSISVMDGILSSIENRAALWKHKSYTDDLSLSESVTVGFSLPIGLTVGFNISIEFTVTVRSILAAFSKRNKLLSIQQMEGCVNLTLVRQIEQQGFPYGLAVEAVYQTHNSSMEAALHWAIEHVETHIQTSHPPRAGV
jgi:hypothetical protein